ncbi:PAS domain-containing hybrid sensor histidine kinase/response regulator [bacterium]|nr:MAG: PAS domain-containing hybrid sensor histidine kinase/response regulator [bacterium]
MDTSSSPDGAPRPLLELLAGIDLALWVWDPAAGRMAYASPACADVWGATPAELAVDGRAWLAHVHAEDREKAALGLKGKELRDDEYRVTLPGGTERWVRGRSFPVRDSAGKTVRVAGLAEDVTQRRQMADALQQREAELLQAQKMEAIGRLAGSVAHDFNNMLTVIMGYSQHMLEAVKDGEPRRAELELIARSAEKAGALTHQLLTFSRRQVTQTVLVDLNAVVSDMHKMLRRLIGDDIELKVTLAPDLPAVLGDPNQFGQVLMNLAVNARDAMPKGGRIAMTTAALHLDAPLRHRHGFVPTGDWVSLTLSDTGSGMDDAVQSRIFEPFFTTKESGKGTGLGLAIIYGIVAQAGGHVVCDSAVGKGTSFRILLPKAKSGSVVAVMSDAAPAASLRGTETILLVEDEEWVRQVARMTLAEAGYSVVEASGPAEALYMAGHHHGPIHLMLTDVVMLQMTGFELADQLAPTKPDMRLMFMSGYTDNPIPDKHRATPFLAKPFTPSGLLQKVRAVLSA